MMATFYFPKPVSYFTEHRRVIKHFQISALEITRVVSSSDLSGLAGLWVFGLAQRSAFSCLRSGCSCGVSGPLLSRGLSLRMLAAAFYVRLNCKRVRVETARSLTAQGLELPQWHAPLPTVSHKANQHGAAAEKQPCLTSGESIKPTL